MRQRLVLVASSARLFASGARDWPISYELRSISTRLGDRFGDRQCRRLEFAAHVRWIMRYIGGERWIRTIRSASILQSVRVEPLSHSADACSKRTPPESRVCSRAILNEHEIR